jgi:hypothetical protein
MKKLLIVGQHNTGKESRTNTLDAGTLAQSMNRETMQNSAHQFVSVFGYASPQLELGELRHWIENIVPDQVVLLETDPTHLAGAALLRQLAQGWLHQAPARFTVDVVPIHKPTIDKARIELWGKLIEVINRP